jgi:hypothetical protein
MDSKRTPRVLRALLAAFLGILGVLGIEMLPRLYASGWTAILSLCAGLCLIGAALAAALPGR